MATETLQFEKQAVQTAEQELKEARQAFQEALNAYKAATEKLYVEASEYRSKRGFWLE